MNMNNMNKEMNNIVPAMTNMFRREREAWIIMTMNNIMRCLYNIMYATTNMFRREREGGGTSTEVRSLSSLLRFLLLQFLEVCSIQFVLTYMV